MKILGALSSAGLVLSVFAPATFVPVTAAVASSPSQTQCEMDGGIFIRDGGYVYCIKDDHVGNSDNSQTVTDTEGSNGTLNNRPKHQEECDGTGNTSSPQDHCH